VRFRLGAESLPDPDNLNPDPILLEDGIGSAHRALVSSWTTHVAGTGGLHTDINSNYVASYILDENASPDAMAKMWTHGISIFQKPNVSWSGERWGFELNGDGLDYNENFEVTPQGSVTATEFIGDVILTSPDGTKYKIEVQNDGTLTTTSV